MGGVDTGRPPRKGQERPAVRPTAEEVHNEGGRGRANHAEPSRTTDAARRSRDRRVGCRGARERRGHGKSALRTDSDPGRTQPRD